MTVEAIVRKHHYVGVVRPCVGPRVETGVVGFVKHGLVFDQADPAKVIGYEGGAVDGPPGCRFARSIDESGIERTIGWVDYQIQRDSVS